MQVVCHQCGAKYEFDPSTIPSEGYDAECTSCKAVFFVAPEHGALITVTCEHCGTVYRFAASKIPAEGYDAQCTQCHKVFFVSTSRAVKPATKDVVSSVPPRGEGG